MDHFAEVEEYFDGDQTLLAATSFCKLDSANRSGPT
jgi:hypothetical protein